MSAVDEVKIRLDIVQLIGTYASLQKAGRSFRASCPFHNERTPSFYVFPERGTWRCFGACAEGGDAFSFVMKKEGVPFGEALRRLAAQAGVELPEARRPAEAIREEERLTAVNQMAVDYFHNLLLSSPAGEGARRYLAGRGIRPEAIEAFQLGLGPQGWDGLQGHLRELGVEQELAVRTGLLVLGDGGRIYDRFRGRLMFPIRDRQGRAVGFGARALDDSSPKYLNTPQTPVFDKGTLLYGLARAQEGVRRTGTVVIVEGYTDVIQAHQQGYTNVVASMGTALTERQVALLRGLAGSFILALDPDAAGEEATRRSLESSWGVFRHTALVGARGGVYYRRGEAPELRILDLPPGVDPDELIARDPGEWERRMAEAPPLLEYLFQWGAGEAAEGPTGKLAVEERLAHFIFELQNPYEQDQYIRRLAQMLEVDERTLKARLKRPVSGARRRRPTPAAREVSTSALEDSGRDRLEEHCLALLLQVPALEEYQEELSSEHFRRPENREIFVRWREGGSADMEGRVDDSLAGHLGRLQREPVPPLDERGLQEALQSCVRLLEERRLRAMKDEEKALEGAATGNFTRDADRQAALERADRLKALLLQGRSVL